MSATHIIMGGLYMSAIHIIYRWAIHVSYTHCCRRLYMSAIPFIMGGLYMSATHIIMGGLYMSAIHFIIGKEWCTHMN